MLIFFIGVTNTGFVFRGIGAVIGAIVGVAWFGAHKIYKKYYKKEDFINYTIESQKYFLEEFFLNIL